MNCSTCKEPFPSDAVFCPNCGAKPPAGHVAVPQPRETYDAAPPLRTYSGMDTVAPMRESRATVLAPGTLFAGRYEVVRKLGEGGMGIVYAAKDTNTGEEIVLKLIHPDLVTGDEAVKRLMAEGLTARQIRHPNIVAVYDVALSNGQPYFTMELVRGGTLRSWMVNAMRAGTETSLAAAVGLMKAMLAGLAEAHRMGVVHRDLKPENVLLNGDPNAGDYALKILDFGIARAVTTPLSSRSSAGGSGAVGTPLYMAPEQMTSAEAVKPAADLYSLSVMFYELLMEAVPQGRWEPVSRSRPDVPAAIDALIEKGLSARPRSRFASATEYGSALDAAMTPVTPPTPTPTPSPTTDPVPPPPPVTPIEPIRVEPVRPEPVRPEPVIVPDPTPGPAGPFRNMSKRTRMWIGAAAVLIALAGIGWLRGDDPPLVPPIEPIEPIEPLEPDDPPPQPPPQAPVFNASGIWQNDLGNSFTVQHDGNTFRASGAVTGLGPVNMSGTLTLQGTQFGVFTMAGQQIYQGVGQVRGDQRHIDYEIRDQFGQTQRGALHINHAPGQ